MPRYIVVHPAAFSEEQLAPLTKEQMPEGIAWISTFCSFADNLTYCHWTAPTKPSLFDLFTKYEIPVTSIHEVRLFDPVTAKLEPEGVEIKVAQPV